VFSGFNIYKPGQGRYVRIGTAVGVGIALLAFSYFLYTVLKRSLVGIVGIEGIFDYINLGVPAVFFVGVGILIYRLLNKPRTVDFLLATEGEMKKVSWSSRKEIIGSTKVVIVTSFIMAGVLFAVDLVLNVVFRWMGVMGGG